MSTEPVRAQLDACCKDTSRADETRRSMLRRAGGAAGVLALLGLAEPARAATTRFDDLVEIVPPPGTAALRVVSSGAVPRSPVTGGALNLDNTGSSGAGAVIHSNRGADALGRLLTVNQANPANPQQAVRIQNAGTGHALSVYHNPGGGAGDPSAAALDVTSTNQHDTALGVRGQEAGKGTVKITHSKPDTADTNAAALSIALEGAGTACQGIFIGNAAGNPTSGDLLNIRNGGPGTDRLRLTAAGRLVLAAGTSEGGLELGSAGGSARLYVKDANLVVEWNDGASTLYTAIPLAPPGPYPVSCQVTTDTTPP